MIRLKNFVNDEAGQGFAEKMSGSRAELRAELGMLRRGLGICLPDTEHALQHVIFRMHRRMTGQRGLAGSEEYRQ